MVCVERYRNFASTQIEHHAFMASNSKHVNALIQESSPYLLQHAHNPVNWLPWNKETLEHAKKTNKPILVSIGYSACHWCHVMAHESFEDAEVAHIMNTHFTCIKVDREERPDVDHRFMDAVQLITQQGGWPLNCFALPNGKPFYGGTYFTKEAWKEVLMKVNEAFGSSYEEVLEYAQRLENGLKATNTLVLNSTAEAFDTDLLNALVKTWQTSFDQQNGGSTGAPKFPLPSNYSFLLAYSYWEQDEEVEAHVKHTLEKMSDGGIYDHLGGGFCRYAVDSIWKIPHFEKMLYDNAQLISLYADAYKQFHEPKFERVVSSCISWANEWLYDPNTRSYQSALDADSDGEEGSYYVWDINEFKAFLNADEATLSIDYYGLDRAGHWEGNKAVPVTYEPRSAVAKRHNMTDSELHVNMELIRSKMLAYRNERNPPEKDDKSITSWNGLMLVALCDAYRVNPSKDLYDRINGLVHFLTITQRDEVGGLYHTNQKGIPKIQGFLEDYAFAISGLLKVFEITSEKSIYQEIKSLIVFVVEHFKKEDSPYFNYTHKTSEDSPGEKIEFIDNVMPSSNAQMAHNLWDFGILDNDGAYQKHAKQMLHHLIPLLHKGAANYSHWLSLYTKFTYNVNEVVLTGPNATDYQRDLWKNYVPGGITIVASNEVELSLFKGRYSETKNLIYVCANRTCNAPVSTIEEAIELME